MEKYTQKRLKELIEQGHAIDLSTIEEEIKGLKKVGYSSGINGINGALFEDKQGQLYAISERNSKLFQYA